MNNLPIFDLHCDTLYECLKSNKSLIDNDLHLSFKRLSEYKRFCQTLAMWSDDSIDEETAWKRFFEARELLERELRATDEVRLCTNGAQLSECERDGKSSVFLAVEGGKLLGDNLDRVDMLYEADVRFLTLVWDKICKIGGAHDTDVGLTEFGRQVVIRANELGIIPDVSHASDKMTDEVLEICEGSGRVCVATHSNSRAICSHRRNLTDERFKRISRLGGIVGISLATMHLTKEESCTIDDIARHIEHYLELGGERTVCLGADLDGVEKLPQGINSASDLYKIAEKLGRINYTDDLIKNIFYANARNFIFLWLK